MEVDGTEKQAMCDRVCEEGLSGTLHFAKKRLFYTTVICFDDSGYKPINN